TLGHCHGVSPIFINRSAAASRRVHLYKLSALYTMPTPNFETVPQIAILRRRFIMPSESTGLDEEAERIGRDNDPRLASNSCAGGPSGGGLPQYPLAPSGTSGRPAEVGVNEVNIWTC